MRLGVEAAVVDGVLLRATSSWRTAGSRPSA